MSTIEIKSDMFTFDKMAGMFVGEVAEVLNFACAKTLPETLAIVSVKTGNIMAFVPKEAFVDNEGDVQVFVFKAAPGEPKHLAHLEVHLIND